MKIKISTLLLIAIVIGLCHSLNASDHIPGQLLVQLRKKADIHKICSDLKVIDGIRTGIEPVRMISKHLNVWLVEYDAQAIVENDMLYNVHSHEMVVLAQFNHVVNHRSTIPNDTQFSSQWQYINTGANGGTIDGDIDADEAWDITTGGLTALGDTIVVCALDDGIDLTHPDFGNNRWRNNLEIPNNSIDDDGNGYVDDKEGWSIVTNSDNIAGGGHGTPVAGIMGAQGNNGIGVTGVNWDVEVMILKNNFNTNEAAVLEAYEYPLTMRIKYNETDGDEGAFVVSTNASWGIDFGQPSNAPLWCAMYDTLGAYGILSCGATINGNQNVDVVGDLPTACPSDFLISVTNCDNTDNKVTNAGYGLTTIDLGAHGAGAWTTNGSGGYSGFGGTSGATPHVTGAIGLLYSAPCPGLIVLAKSDPALAASMVRQYILNGVDSNASLQGITSTGGRLNLHNSLLELLNDCPTGSCFEPFSISTSSVSDTSAIVQWSTISTVDSVTLQYRIAGTTPWITIVETSGSLTLNNLMGCTDYELRLKASCDTAESAFTSVIPFQTDGCCKYPDGITTSLISDSSAQISWNAVLAANSYSIQLTDTAAGTTIILANITSSNQLLGGLQSCTVYEVQLLTACDTGNTMYSPGIYFKTSGCGACVDLTYCDSDGDNSSLEWISNVTLGSINNTTASDGGYGDYTGGPTTDLVRGNSYTISLSPDYSGTNFTEFFRVWIDFNHNGTFSDPGELVYNPGTGTTSTVMGSVMVPITATLGLTRMRVAMKWNAVSTECEQGFGFGEVEDYCVNIRLSTDLYNIERSDLFAIYPNPANDQLHIVSATTKPLNGYKVELMDMLGRNRLSEQIRDVHHLLNVSSLAPGVYFIRISGPQSSDQISKLIIE